MKKLSYILFVVLLTACSLEEDPRDQITEDQVYTTPEALYRNTVATLYTYLGGTVDGQGLQGTGRCVWDLQTFSSDEAIIPTRGTDWYDGGLWQSMYKHSWNAGNEIVGNSWFYLYKVITHCNRSLEILERYKSLAGYRYDEWQYEVRALRAMYYWYLIDLFGDVPLVTATNISMNDVTRESRSKVFKFCENELTAAMKQVASANSNKPGEYYGRMTKEVVLFVLAKLMLNAEVYTGTPRWEDCIAYCEQNHRNELAKYYPDNFIVHNESSPENIFVIPLDKDLIANVQWNLRRSLHYRHANAWGFVGENGISATQRVLDINGFSEDEEQDLRFYTNYYYGTLYGPDGRAILDRQGKQLIYNPREVKMDLSDSPYLETAGARMRKYEIDRNSYKGGLLVDNDIVLFRYADVLLMRAEAMLRLGQDGHIYYDRVRERAFMEPRPYTLDNLYDERLIELAWEGWRRQDMIRFGRYKSLYEGPDAVDESDGHTTLFPIPAEVRTLNPKITQNPGY